MKCWTIKNRLVAGFAAILGLVAVLTATSDLRLRQARNTAQFLTVDALPGLTDMSQIKGLVGDTQLDVLRDLSARTPEEKITLDETIASLIQAKHRELTNYENPGNL